MSDPINSTGKYIIAWVPACMHENCAIKLYPDQPNVLTFCFPQAKMSGANRKEDLYQPKKGTQWVSMLCCHCKKDVMPTHLAVFQKLSPDAMDITKAMDVEQLGGWHLASMIETPFFEAYGVN